MNEQAQSAGKAIVVALRSEPFQRQLHDSLPPDVTVDRFTAVSIVALNNNPELALADRQSLYNAIVRASQDGLMPDGREGALVVFDTNVGTRDNPNYIKKVQWMPMILGIKKRLAQCGVSMDAQVVHENDEFTYRFGDDAAITHIPPKLGKPRGELIGAYAIATLSDGTVYREVMEAAQIEAVREQSRGKNSLMWTKFRSEGYRKTVARRLAKNVPVVDARTDEMFKRDDEQFTFDQDGTDAGEVPGGETAPAAAAPVQQKRPKALEAVVQATKPAPAQPEPVAAVKPAPEPKQAQQPAPAPAQAGQQDDEDVF